MALKLGHDRLKRYADNEMAMPRALILAGPNGAGKTTFARDFLVGEGHCPTFINADLIAVGLSPFRPDTMAVKAMRLMMAEVESCVAGRSDFAVESTLAGRSYLNHIRSWQAQGYHVEITFLSLPAVEIAIRRVAQRVVQGGHHIPEAIIRRRFERGLENFTHLYAPLADSWQHYDASVWPPILRDEGGQA